MEAAYDPESNYHTGSIPVQEAKAQLGVFKTTDDVPVRYRLRNYARELDSDEVWRAFLESLNKTWDETTGIGIGRRGTSGVSSPGNGTPIP